MLLVAHTLRSKDRRQVHTLKQSCSGTSVVPVPGTQKPLSFGSQSHDTVITLSGFFRQRCAVVICFLVFELLWVVFSRFALQPRGYFLYFLHESCSLSFFKKKIESVSFKKTIKCDKCCSKVTNTKTIFIVRIWLLMDKKALLTLGFACSLRPCVYKPFIPLSNQLCCDPREDI